MPSSVPPTSSVSPPSSSSSTWCPSCPSYRSCGPLTRRYWDHCTSSTYGVKFCSICVMLECAYIALTGRGVISILQAIIGVIFSVEGFWGAVRFDRPSIKRFLIFLFFDFLTGIAVGVLDLETVDEYCTTAADGSAGDCNNTYSLYAYILIGLKAVTIPMFFLVSTLFYLKLLSVHQAQRERLGTGAGGREAMQRRVGKEGRHPLYWQGELMAGEDGRDDEEEAGYPGTLIQGDHDGAKQMQIRTEMALMRGDSEELSQLQDEGSVVIRDSDEDEKG